MDKNNLFSLMQEILITYSQSVNFEIDVFERLSRDPKQAEQFESQPSRFRFVAARLSLKQLSNCHYQSSLNAVSMLAR